MGKGDSVILSIKYLGQHLQFCGEGLMNQITNEGFVVHKGINLTVCEAFQPFRRGFKLFELNMTFHKVTGARGSSDGADAYGDQIMRPLEGGFQFADGQ